MINTERIKVMRDRSQCLIPKPEFVTKDNTLLTSHEYSNCDCEVIFLLDLCEKQAIIIALMTNHLRIINQRIHSKGLPYGTDHCETCETLAAIEEDLK
jgi:hypothetical protein